MANVRGTLMGSSAFVHRNARAREEPLLVRLLANHPLVCGSASSLTSWPARSKCVFYIARKLDMQSVYSLLWIWRCWSLQVSFTKDEDKCVPV